MVKEAQQPLKQIRSEEMTEEDEDRISKLPDCLLAEIFSRLPSKKLAITTGTLSKRWKHIWTGVTNLIFLHPFERNYGDSPDLSLNFFPFINKTLTLHRQLKLKKFTVQFCHDHGLESHIHNWISYVVNCNVEELHLILRGLQRGTEFALDEFIFTNSCFTNLTLSACTINPTGKISWEKLRSLCIWHVNLDKDLIENILSGSLVLETLVLEYCYGFRRLNITLKSVKNLVFSGYLTPKDPEFSDIIEIKAPNILSLKIQLYLLVVNLLLLNVSSLVEADLNYKPDSEEAEEEMLNAFILKLFHVKDLKIGIWCSEVVDRLKAKGFLSPSNVKVLKATSSPLLACELQKQVDATSSSSSSSGEIGESNARYREE